MASDPNTSSLVSWLQFKEALQDEQIPQLMKELDVPLLRRVKFTKAIQRISKVNKKLGSFDDTASVVSSVAPAFRIGNPLIALIGIGEFDGKLDNLLGVPIDYQNLIDTFVKIWKFSAFYQLSNGKTVYLNDINELEDKKNYKIKWNFDEIKLFVKQATKLIMENKHDGLVFAISGHGNKGNVIYDSFCKSHKMNEIFRILSPQYEMEPESSQQQTQNDESMYLSRIPKIFFLDVCRGSKQATMTPAYLPAHSDQIEMKHQHLQEIQEQKTQKIQQIQKNKTQKVTNDQSLHKSLHKQKESFALKAITKDQAQVLSPEMSNFYNIYANIDGFAVADGSKHGGIFIRSVCKVFKDKKFVFTHELEKIILKIRDYTKREASLCDFVYTNFTQLVQDVSTLEKSIIFGNNINTDINATNIVDYGSYTHSDNNKKLSYNFRNISNIISGNNYNDFEIDDEIDDQMEQDKLVVTNLSQTNKIGVLIEFEENNEDRNEMLVYAGSASEDGLHGKGYTIIETNGGNRAFKRMRNDVFITLFVLNVNRSNNIVNDEIYDRRRFMFDNYLYFKNTSLTSLIDLRPKCNSSDNSGIYFLRQAKCNTNLTQQATKCKECNEHEKDLSEHWYFCRECKYYLCESCCHLAIIHEEGVQMEQSNPNDIHARTRTKTKTKTKTRSHFVGSTTEESTSNASDVNNNSNNKNAGNAGNVGNIGNRSDSNEGYIGSSGGVGGVLSRAITLGYLGVRAVLAWQFYLRNE